MKEIVEDGRRRAEVAWAMGAVRFDADFIEGYDRQGQELWRAQWAEIESAVPGPDSLRLCERGGRVLGAPPTPEMAAACHWLLPEPPELAPSLGPSIPDRIGQSVFLLIPAGFVAQVWMAFTFVDGIGQPLARSFLAAAIVLGAAALSIGACPFQGSWLGPLQLQPPRAAVRLRLSFLLHDKGHWFRRAKHQRHTHFRLAFFLLFLWPSLWSLFSTMEDASFSLNLNLMISALWLAVIGALCFLSLRRRPPEGAWLQVQGKTVRFLPPGQTQLVEVEMKDGRTGSAGRDWTIWLDDFVLCRDAPELIETNQA